MYSQLLLPLLLLLLGCTHYQKKTYENQDYSQKQDTKICSLGQYRRDLIAKKNFFHQYPLIEQEDFLLARLDRALQVDPSLDLLEEILELGQRSTACSQEQCARQLFYLLQNLEERALKGKRLRKDQRYHLWSQWSRLSTKQSRSVQASKIFSALTQEYPGKKDFLRFLQKSFEQQNVSGTSLTAVKKVGFIIEHKQAPVWMKELISLWEREKPPYEYYCFFGKDLKASYRTLLSSDIDVIFTYGFSKKDFSFLSASQKLPLISLQAPFSCSLKNLYFFPPKPFFEQRSLEKLSQGDQEVIVLAEAGFLSAKSSSSSRERGQQVVLDKENYRSVIDRLLQIPERRKYFEQYFSTSIDYLGLPAAQNSVLILQTSPALARLIYPYWKLKSPIENPFLGPSSLRELNPLLDQSLSGMYLPSSTGQYQAKVLFALIESLPQLLAHPAFMQPVEQTLCYRQHNVIVQEDRFTCYRVGK